MKNRVKATTVVLNRSGSLDLAKADPTTMNKSQNHIGRGHGGMNVWEMCLLR